MTGVQTCALPIFFEGKVANYSKQSLEWDDDSIVPVKVPTVEETWCMSQQTYKQAVANKDKNPEEAVDRSDECVGCQ